jgi:hypothetical protein
MHSTYTNLNGEMNNGEIVLVVLNETEEVKSFTIQIEDNYVEIEVDRRRTIATMII